MADPVFEDPRLAEVYDPLDPDRSDLDAYVAMVDEFGTGTLACLLARRGLGVTALDPAGASLAVARASPAPIGCGGCTATPRTWPRCRWTW